MTQQAAEATQAEGQAEQPQGGEAAKTFDADYVKKLRDEAAKYRTEAKANADAAKRLAEIEEAQKSEAQRAAERLADAEERAAKAERDATRLRVIAETQLHPDQHEFVFGDTEDEMRARAEKLKAMAATAPTAPGPRPDMSQASGGDAPLNGDPLLRDLKSKLGIR
jgi:hypothetical protein